MKEKLSSWIACLCVALTLVAFPVWVALAQSDSYEAGRQVGITGNQGVGAATEHPPEFYPGYNANPSEQTYYQSGLVIEEQAREQLPSHDVGRSVEDSAYSRPRFLIGPDEPELQTESSIMEAGTALTETYSGCRSLGSGDGATNLCGEDLYCPSGDCAAADRVPEPTTPEEMAQAASWLAAAQNAADELDPETLEMFTGEALRCKKHQFGFSDCCSDSGWGVDAGLASCSDEEIRLGRARQAKRVHYVGRHTSGGFLDEREYETYCVFNSKLSRILQEQGRPQLPLGWGRSRRPICRGLATAEVERLDWSLMDLSEFYEDAVAAAQAAGESIESTEILEQRIRDRIESMESGGGG